MFKVTVTSVGRSMGIVLPKEALAYLKAGEGDVLSLVESPEGLTLKPYHWDLEQQIGCARKVMKKYRNALYSLGK